MDSSLSADPPGEPNFGPSPGGSPAQAIRNVPRGVFRWAPPAVASVAPVVRGAVGAGAAWEHPASMASATSATIPTRKRATANPLIRALLPCIVPHHTAPDVRMREVRGASAPGYGLS